MEILICALNTKYVHSSLAPWYLKASAEKNEDVACEVYESTINENSEKIIDDITSKKYDIIGFSTYIWNIDKVLHIAEQVKRITGAKILLGGPEVSYNAKEILEKNMAVDFVISGEGEDPIYLLTRGDGYSKIPGLCYRDGKEIIVKEPYVSKNDPPCPYTEDYFKALNTRISYIETSRGCPYRCAFCLSGRCGGVRFFDLEESKRRILLLAESGTKTVKFIDRTFNADKKRAKEIFSFIIENYGKKIPPRVCFHFEIEGEIIDDETVEILSKAPLGAIQIEIGLQSFNEKTLEYINRKTNLPKLTENIEKLIAIGNIHVHIDLIAGLPYEDLKSFENSFNRAHALYPHMLQFGFLKLLHGADMRENAEKFKCEYNEKAPYEVISTPYLSNAELQKMHKIEDVFDKLYNSGRFLRTSKYIAESSKNAFKSYTSLAIYLENHQISGSLDDFARAVYDHFSSLDCIDKDELRDNMALDRLASNRMGVLPSFLKYKTEKIKSYLNFLEQDEKTRKKNAVKRSATFLKKKNLFAYVDYDEKNSVTGQYNIHFLQENEIF